MRSAGLVESERDGREVRYHLADPDVIRACDLMRQVLGRRLTRLGELAPPSHRITPTTRAATQLFAPTTR
jgi:DNA-binding transcriptional ArsR family regulator